jgi:pimeloyl-ACP methyl ester carboxylesterase
VAGEVRELDVDTGALRLAVRDHPGGEPAVVCLHGLASNARWWDLVAPRLAPRRVIALDLRGHGRSDKPDDGYDYPTVVGDVRGAVRTLGVGPVVAAGHSWGASVALWWAAEHAEEVRAVVCVDGGVGDLRGYFGDTWERARVTMRPPDLQGLDPSALRGFVARMNLAGDGDVDAAVDILRANFEDMGDGRLRPRLRVERHMKIAYELYHLDASRLYAGVQCPVLFVLASRDGVDARREAVETALSMLPRGSEVRWVDGIHDLPVQRPAAVAAAMQEFLGRIGL